MRSFKALSINILISSLELLPCCLLRVILPRKIVLYGHLISDDNQCLAAQRYRYPSYSQFDSFYNKFTSIGYKFVNFEEFRKLKYSRMILLTFDDGFKEVFEFYQKYKIGLIVFIPTDILGDEPSSLGGRFNNPQKSNYLSLDNIKQLKENGVHIGFHTHTHKKLMDFESDLNELVLPVNHKHLFSLPLVFAYPFESPQNYSVFDSYLFSQGFEYVFDSKSLFEINGKHIYRISIDVGKDCVDLNFIERNIYRAFVSTMYRKVKSLCI